MREGLVCLLAMLVGQMVVVTMQSGERYVGVLSAARTEASPLGVVLTAAQALTSEGKGDVGEVISSLVIPGSDLAEIDATNAQLSASEELEALQQNLAKSKTGFRTDTEISQAGRLDERALQKWDDVGEALEETNLETSNSAQGWDQFAANEARFGIKSNYEETLYTTKLDRSGKDFKQREREADRIAREILEQGSDNVHLAEERNQVDASEINEEDKYGAVVRNTNADASPSARSNAPEAKPAPAPGSKALTADFRQFVSAERERLVVRKAELAQKEKQNRLTDLKAWAQNFRLTTPVPADLQPKKEEKKQEAKDKPASSFKMNAAARSFNPTAASFTPGARPRSS